MDNRTNGPTGPTGPTGSGINVLGFYNTFEELIAAHPVGQVGDAYIVGNDLYVWNADTASWINTGIVAGPTGPTGVTGPTGPTGAIWNYWAKHQILQLVQ